MIVSTWEGRVAAAHAAVFASEMAGRGVDVTVVQCADPLAAVSSGEADAAYTLMNLLPMDTGDLVIAAVLRRMPHRYVAVPRLDGVAAVRYGGRCWDEDYFEVEGDDMDCIDMVTEGGADCALVSSLTLEVLDLDVESEDIDGVTAPGMGAGAVVCRKDDSGTVSVFRGFDDLTTRLEVTAERGLLSLMGADVDHPIYADAVLDGYQMLLKAENYGFMGQYRFGEKLLPVDFVMDEVLGLAEFLTGKRDEII